jgi:hypothetical protein
LPIRERVGGRLAQRVGADSRRPVRSPRGRFASAFKQIATVKVAIANRRGYVIEPEVGGIGFSVELRHPHRVWFKGLTEELALAWALNFSMGAAFELGIGAFRSS